MGIVLSVIEGVIGVVGSFIGAMTATQLEALAAVARRWLSRIGLALWPDVREPDHPKPLLRGPRGR